MCSQSPVWPTPVRPTPAYHHVPYYPHPMHLPKYHHVHPPVMNQGHWSTHAGKTQHATRIFNYTHPPYSHPADTGGMGNVLQLDNGVLKNPSTESHQDYTGGMGNTPEEDQGLKNAYDASTVALQKTSAASTVPNDGHKQTAVDQGNDGPAK